MSSFKDKDQLFRKMRNLYLLPSTTGLRMADLPLFKLRLQHPTYTQPFKALGVPFLDPGLSEQAHRVIEDYGLAITISNIPALLDAFPPTITNSLSSMQCETILKYLAGRLDDTVGRERIQRLKAYPLFPVARFTAVSDSSKVTKEWAPIRDGHSVRSIGSPPFLPSIEGITFLALDQIAPTLVRHLEPLQPRSLSDGDVLMLAVEQFASQDSDIIIAVLDYIIKNRPRIPQNVFDTIKAKAFIYTQDGSRRTPAEVIDPISPFAPLFPSSQDRFARQLSTSDRTILQHLKVLRLLPTDLSLEILRERIQHIVAHHAQNDSLVLAQNLLKLLASSKLDLIPGAVDPEARWLPTNRGLCKATDCRDASDKRALFNRVLAVVEVDAVILPASLKKFFGWDEPIAVEVLVKQLDEVLREGNAAVDTVAEIIKELAGRNLSEADYADLRATTMDRQWVPTASRTLQHPKVAVFDVSPSTLRAGFHQIVADEQGRRFLRVMGCKDRYEQYLYALLFWLTRRASPSTESVIERLHGLKTQVEPDIPSIAHNLLLSLPDNLTDLERAKLLLPDDAGLLQPFRHVLYNDIGERAKLASSDSNIIAHPLIDEDLARKLKINRLGLKFAELQDLGENLGQSFLTTLRRHLKGYTERQFLLEFLANAEDARATQFSIALNHVVLTGQDSRVLSPAMAYLSRLPSLIVYNNARFTEEDFKGICRTSIGGKQGRPDTIGEFGLGALSMYHFTDVCGNFYFGYGR